MVKQSLSHTTGYFKKVISEMISFQLIHQSSTKNNFSKYVGCGAWSAAV